jgi:hypothetical protein
MDVIERLTTMTLIGSQEMLLNRSTIIKALVILVVSDSLSQKRRTCSDYFKAKLGKLNDELLTLNSCLRPSPLRWPILAEGGLMGGSYFADVSAAERPFQPIGTRSAVLKFFGNETLSVSTKDLFFSGTGTGDPFPNWWIFKPVPSIRPLE